MPSGITIANHESKTKQDTQAKELTENKVKIKVMLVSCFS